MQGERLLLYHYTNDSLCQWKPGPDTLKALACKYCILSNDGAELRGHFGSAEHSYGHWLDLGLPEVEFTLWRLLRSHAAIACPRHRDAAPLRLISWMSCEPPPYIEALLHQLMLLFAEVQPVDSEQVIAAARRSLSFRTSLRCLGMTYGMLLSRVSWLAGTLLLHQKYQGFSVASYADSPCRDLCISWT